MIKEINSVDNINIKSIAKLHQKKYRDAENKFICSGFNIVEEAIDNKYDMECVVLREDLRKHEIFEKIMAQNIDVFLVSREVMKKISDTENTQGIMAVFKKPNNLPKFSERKRLTVVDRIQDPGNLGTIIRSAAAAGFSAVIIVKGTVDVYSPKVVRAAAGTIFRMPIVFMDSAECVSQYLKEQGCKLFVTKVDSGISYYDADFKADMAIVIGNEGNGVSDEMTGMADEFLNIPMSADVESLNAGIAASILMFEAARQNS